MTYSLNVTHDPQLSSWVESANQAGCPFPIQNLPLGVFSSADKSTPRAGIAIGDYVLDLLVLEQKGLLNSVKGLPAGTFAGAVINPFLRLGPSIWSATRARLSQLLSKGCDELRHQDWLPHALMLRSNVTMHLPMEIPGYTDFYSSKEHATNVGCMFRDPKNALLPNWLHIPIGYNGRASSVVISGTNVKRPNGQLKLPEQDQPIFSACRKLDFELETAFVIGVGNELGVPIPLSEAENHIYGMVLLNDWSARDIQQWEYVPLGPFNSKTFATSISPWLVSLEALLPFRTSLPTQDPSPLPYLKHSAAEVEKAGVNIELFVSLKTAGGCNKEICKSNFKYLYWSMAQQLAHHTVSGCNTRAGDLMGSGTISGPTDDSFGSLLELTWNGQKPISFDDGSSRTFIEDGDVVSMTGVAKGKHYSLGFGDVVGKIMPASA
jgi:fumarylacetoacetase